MFDYGYQWNQLTELKFGLFWKGRGARNNVPGIKTRSPCESRKAADKKAICCFKLKSGTDISVKLRKNPPERRRLANVRSKLCSITRICQSFLMVEKLQK
jgi:hypothetical protein